MALGYEHPDFLLEKLTAKQITEWEAFNRIQPIGSRRMDFYFAQIMTSLHNIAIGFSGSKNIKQFTLEDFVPNWTGIEEEEQVVVMSAEKMKQFFVEFAEIHNKQVSKNKSRDSKPPKSIKQ